MAPGADFGHGARRAARQVLVHDHAEKVLRRELGPNATVQRINDTEYLIVQPDGTITLLSRS